MSAKALLKQHPPGLALGFIHGRSPARCASPSGSARAAPAGTVAGKGRRARYGGGGGGGGPGLCPRGAPGGLER